MKGNLRMNKKQIILIAVIIILLSLSMPIFIALIIDLFSFITAKLNIPTEITVVYPYKFEISEISSTIISFIFSLSTLFISYNTFFLSKKISDRNEKNEKLLSHASLISLKNEINNNVEIVLNIANKISSRNELLKICTDSFDKYDQYKYFLSKEEISFLNNLYEYFKKIKNDRKKFFISDKYFYILSGEYKLKNDDKNIIRIINEKEF